MFINHRDLWDTKHLKSELASHVVSEGKSFLYFLVITGFDWLQFTAFRLWPTSGELSSWEQADAMSTLAITIIGLVFLFWCNGGRLGKDFLYRYFPLSFVVGWKFVASVSVVLWFVDLVMQNAPASTVGWASTVILAAFNIAMFVRIGYHMNELFHANRA